MRATILRPDSRAPDSISPAGCQARRPRLIGEVLIVLILVKVYDYVRSFSAARSGPAEGHGQHILDLERLLHVNFELEVNGWLSGRHGLELAAAYWYQYAHIGVTLTVLTWCYVSGPPVLYRRARNALVVTNLVGLTVFQFLPVMPPRLLPGAGFIDAVADAGFGSDHGGPVPADQYAAMPSLHLAWAFWTALVAIALLRGRAGRLFCYLYPAVTAVVVVATANHYELDVVAGIAVAIVATWMTGLLRPDAPAPVRIPQQWAEHQITRRRSRKPNTYAPGRSGTQTVRSRYPSTAPSASGKATPTKPNAAGSATSSAPTPPGDGTSAASDDTTT
jgi:membrane-associated phospholipid phosphatase